MKVCAYLFKKIHITAFGQSGLVLSLSRGWSLRAVEMSVC